jgi:hypothetical protein
VTFCQKSYSTKTDTFLPANVNTAYLLELLHNFQFFILNIQPFEIRTLPCAAASTIIIVIVAAAAVIVVITTVIVAVTAT